MKKSLSRLAIIAAVFAPVAGYAQNYSNTNLGPAVNQAQNAASVPMVREEIWASGWSGKVQYRDVPMYKTPKAPKPHCGVFQTCPGVTKIGLGKGDFIVRLGALATIPNNTSSRTSVGGRITASNGVMAELSANYFVTDNLAFELIASSTRHSIWAKGTAAGNVHVGKAWVIPPTITAQWHFRPHKAFNPYVGVGLTVAFWHNVKPGGGIAQKIGLETTVGPAFNVGFDYQVVGNWFFNMDAKQILLNQRVHINDSPNRIDARTSLNPTVVSAGIGYRF
ncbi:Outer membrane protein OmpW (OmpW) (PDB:2F1T) [Commensalibacter communis]|uniref:Outer membrane protein OmpW (OmpW) n=1 Tax=Commensalibacter communis TaxID=2972786 RepID=A0A9W4XHP6_9PROT|nr:OmpW family outer membrane protein [Commensalibacter communis]CAI3936560.1 Outer membrane protein OmpW (OmpW) (PDB:2F1T) [Commensalibacter communis]CAI3938493.1 Outer membrane protein OmpW (OmpW) (PDB:2F1T) [Commensalibacter communis]CAI3941603.1 Outer membrane protein OmpW (OmpW) (PDB:2F1T) [Commensalibacter communis]CAI3941656.1 Outer membrane protein OmpW (OmpW) (PDB:2F1T) [Commensalibacter communis]CAI3941839.1 Outer membrane protein OmpW (OmpW) (PDB:2F1T) [Commensalibacter communis]